MLPPEDLTVKNLSHSEQVLSPLFSSMVKESGVKFASKEANSYELRPCFLVNAVAKNGAGDGVELVSCQSGVELSGSRFPLFSPHIAWFIVDMTGHHSLVHKTKVLHTETSDFFKAVGVVATCNDALIHVSVPFTSQQQLKVTVRGAMQLADKLKLPRTTSFALCSFGAFMKGKGEYLLNFGPFGTVSFALIYTMDCLFIPDLCSE